MLKTLLTAAFIAAATAATATATATPLSHDTPLAEHLGALCEAGDRAACHQLVTLTDGHCAAPAGSGCRYGLSLAPVRTVVGADEPMVLVPGLEFQGPSRISTVEHCLEVTGVADWRSLITDAELESMNECLTEHT